MTVAAPRDGLGHLLRLRRIIMAVRVRLGGMNREVIFTSSSNMAATAGDRRLDRHSRMMRCRIMRGSNNSSSSWAVVRQPWRRRLLGGVGDFGRRCGLLGRGME
jgi:hypothetical protein